MIKISELFSRNMIHIVLFRLLLSANNLVITELVKVVAVSNNAVGKAAYTRWRAFQVWLKLIEMYGNTLKTSQDPVTSIQTFQLFPGNQISYCIPSWNLQNHLHPRSLCFGACHPQNLLIQFSFYNYENMTEAFYYSQYRAHHTYV